MAGNLDFLPGGGYLLRALLRFPSDSIFITILNPCGWAGAGSYFQYPSRCFDKRTALQCFLWHIQIEQADMVKRP